MRAVKKISSDISKKITIEQSLEAVKFLKSLGISINASFIIGDIKDLKIVLSHTGSAIIIAALTTICGFGSLYFSSYRGLSDMGLAVAIGTVFNLVLVFLFIPLYRSNGIKMK